MTTAERNIVTAFRFIASAERNIATAFRFIASAFRFIATAERNIATAIRFIVPAFRFMATAERNIATAERNMITEEREWQSLCAQFSRQTEAVTANCRNGWYRFSKNGKSSAGNFHIFTLNR